MYTKYPFKGKFLFLLDTVGHDRYDTWTISLLQFFYLPTLLITLVVRKQALKLTLIPLSQYRY